MGWIGFKKNMGRKKEKNDRDMMYTMTSTSASPGLLAGDTHVTGVPSVSLAWETTVVTRSSRMPTRLSRDVASGGCSQKRWGFPFSPLPSYARRVVGTLSTRVL